MKHMRLSIILSCLLLAFAIASPCRAETVIDFMIIYDDTAAQWVENQGGQEIFASQVVEKMNQSMANSEVELIFNLVHTAEADYSYSGDMSVDLQNLQSGSGSLSQALDWRDTYGADLVAMLVDTGSAYGWSGVGYILENPSGDPAWGFTVNSIRAAETSHVVTHEVGHNLGADHSKFQADDPGPNTALNTYSAGWYFTGANHEDYHTIMAYDSDGYGGFYTEAPLFSSPLVEYQGGVAGDAQDGDNARTIRETMDTVASYRTAQTQRAAPPSFIQVPSTSSTGQFTVTWGSSSTSGVTYVLQECTDSGFSSSCRTAYTGTSLSASITARADDTYYYRVKATKDGFEDSEWREANNGCTVSTESAEITVNPVASGTVSFMDIINVAGDISWIRLWTGKQVDGRYVGSYVNTSSFNLFGDGWIEVNDLDNLKLDFAQHDNTILYVLPWASGTSFDWQKFEVDFQASDQVRNSVNMNNTQDTFASEIFKVENIQHGQHWLQLWIGDYLDTSEFNIYGKGWIKASDLSRLVIQGDAFSGGDSLWVRQYSQSPGSRAWADYGWLEFKK